MLFPLLMIACGPGDPTDPSTLDPGDPADIEVAFEPAILTAAQVGDHRVEVSTHIDLPRNTVLRFELPAIWVTNPHPLNRPWQSESAELPHHIHVSSTADIGTPEVTLIGTELSGKNHRYRHTVTVELGRALQADNRITLHLDHTTAPYLAGSQAVEIAVDTPDDVRTTGSATYVVMPGAAERWRLTATTDTWVGEPTEIQLVAMDGFDNVADVDEVIEVSTPDGPVAIDLVDGLGRSTWTPASPGDGWLQADGASHPIRVHASKPTERLWWGDLHAHSRLSKDGLGDGDFAWARDVSDLDFYASTEHAETIDNTPLYEDAFESVKQRVIDFYDPGSFVTLLAYECGLSTGHHNVYFRGLDAVPIPAPDVNHNAQELWTHLDRGTAFTVPHTLGITFRGNNIGAPGPELQEPPQGHDGSGRTGPNVDWTLPQDDELRPMLEIYSHHGQSEYFDTHDALAHEQTTFSNSQSVSGPHYARDAWAAGHHLRVIASSDNHDARPGLAHRGLAAVWAPELTREAIFDALLAGRTYGTTGERIVLGFDVEGEPMGGTVNASGGISGSVSIRAPRNIELAQVMAWDGSDWVAVAMWTDLGRQLDESFSDPQARAVYYLRTELVGETGGRVSRAWSSPVWVE